MTSTKVSLSLGSNLGDKILNIRSAIEALNAVDGISVSKLSSFYQTAPWGDADQDWFMNACAVADVTLQPEDLLRKLKSIEDELGRKITRRWGPRVIDIDILTFGDVTLATGDLTIPHANLINRVFVLIPLKEIWPDLLVHGETLDAHLSCLPREDGDITLQSPS